MTLVELLIAMTLMAIGIAAIVAGFSSGVFAITRSDQASTAAALADQQMEIYRQSSYSSIAVGTDQAPSTQTSLDSGNCNTSTFVCPGPDNRSYWLSTDVAMKCAAASGTALTDPPCSGTDEVKLVTITVRDGSSSGTELVTESSTFDSLAG